MMMDQKTLLLKSRIPLTDVAGFTVSPYSDGIVVILLKKGSETTKKGDLVIVTDKAIELVTKFQRTCRTATNQDAPVKVADR